MNLKQLKTEREESALTESQINPVGKIFKSSYNAKEKDKDIKMMRK